MAWLPNFETMVNVYHVANDLGVRERDCRCAFQDNLSDATVFYYYFNEEVAKIMMDKDTVAFFRIKPKAK